MPDSERSQVLQWGHASKLACHSGFNCNLPFINQLLWWPSISQDTGAFVSACSVCAYSKSFHNPSADLLCPLPIPSHSWSHITVDFFTGLPPSKGSTTILTIFAQFSKAVYYIPFPKLPSATECVVLLVLHVFCLHGICQDITDWGPQFSS